MMKSTIAIGFYPFLLLVVVVVHLLFLVNPPIVTSLNPSISAMDDTETDDAGFVTDVVACVPLLQCNIEYETKLAACSGETYNFSEEVMKTFNEVIIPFFRSVVAFIRSLIRSIFPPRPPPTPTDPPTVQTPTAQPSSAQPPTAKPTVRPAQPIAPPPTTQAPITQTPITQAPITQAPITQAPITQAPITQPPTTNAPVAQAPVALLKEGDNQRRVQVEFVKDDDTERKLILCAYLLTVCTRSILNFECPPTFTIAPTAAPTQCNNFLGLFC